MKRSFLYTAAGIVMMFSVASFADAPAGAPSGATGLCNDGTYYTGATKKGACRGHKGVKDWYAATAASTAPAAPAAAAVPAAPAAPAPPAPPAKPAPKMAAAPTAAAAGGGPGMVWVNSPTKVYHCSDDRWYGKTKSGEYMTEAAAKAAGYRVDHGKACQ